MKSNIFKIITGLIFLILFNGLFFYLGGTEQTEVNWICYGFIHVSYLCILSTPLFCKSGKGSEVLSYSLYLRALFYFLTELTIGIACITINPESSTWPLIIQGTLLAVFLFLQTMSVLANDSTVASIDKQQTESIFIKTLGDKIYLRMNGIEDKDIRKCVVKAYDAIMNSPVESFPNVSNIELSLSNTVDMLCSAIENGDEERIKLMAKRVIISVQERNMMIKSNRTH